MVQHICTWFYVNVYVCQWKSEPAVFFTFVGRDLSLAIWGLEGGCGWCLERQTGIESIKDLIVFEFPQRDERGGGGMEEVLCFKWCGVVHFWWGTPEGGVGTRVKEKETDWGRGSERGKKRKKSSKRKKKNIVLNTSFENKYPNLPPPSYIHAQQAKQKHSVASSYSNHFPLFFVSLLFVPLEKVCFEKPRSLLTVNNKSARTNKQTKTKTMQ